MRLCFLLLMFCVSAHAQPFTLNAPDYRRGLSTTNAPASGFTSNTVPGLIQWNDMSAIAGSDNDPIATMADLSLHGMLLTNSTAGSQPLLKLNIQNGLSVLRFDGVDDKLQTLGKFQTNCGQIYMVQGNLSWVSYRYMATIVELNARILTMYPDGTTFYTGDGSDLFASIVSMTNGVTSTVLNTNVFQIVSQKGSSAVNVSNRTMAVASNPGSVYTKMDIGEILVFDHILTAGENTDVINYLKPKWTPTQ